MRKPRKRFIQKRRGEEVTKVRERRVERRYFSPSSPDVESPDGEGYINRERKNRRRPNVWGEPMINSEIDNSLLVVIVALVIVPVVVAIAVVLAVIVITKTGVILIVSICKS